MSNYRIQQFINNQGTIFTMNENNISVFSDTNGHSFHLFYLLNKPLTFKIHSVLFRNTTNEEYTRKFVLGENVWGGTPRINHVVNKFDFVPGTGDLLINTPLGSLQHTSVNNRQEEVARLEAVARERASRQQQPIAPQTTNQPATQNNFFNDLQRRILADYPRGLRVQGLLRKSRGAAGRNETLNQFLVKFFTDWNTNKNTLFTDDDSVQTVSGRRRSLGDLFMIIKYYYPRVTLKELFTELNNLTSNTSGMRTSYCSTIRKRVWYYSSFSSNDVLNTNQTDEYGNIYSSYSSNI